MKAFALVSRSRKALQWSGLVWDMRRLGGSSVAAMQRWKATAPGVGEVNTGGASTPHIPGGAPYHPSSAATGASSANLNKAMPEEELGKTSFSNTRASSNAKDFQDPREAILEESLKHLKEHGWTAEALSAGAQQLG